jgi:hypothetical protein
VPALLPSPLSCEPCLNRSTPEHDFSSGLGTLHGAQACSSCCLHLITVSSLTYVMSAAGAEQSSPWCCNWCCNHSARSTKDATSSPGYPVTLRGLLRSRSRRTCVQCAQHSMLMHVHRSIRCQLQSRRRGELRCSGPGSARSDPLVSLLASSDPCWSLSSASCLHLPPRAPCLRSDWCSAPSKSARS